MSQEKKDFKPFIPADKIMPELTPFTIILGVILAIVFGGANAYLGARVGMTISASIPAAVISMGIVRGIFRRDSILENNLVQTIGSAGESAASGAVFTLPALFLWFREWDRGLPSYLMMTAVVAVGGTLGVLFMIPLRKALIVKEHGVLPFPEGTACAEVLLAGEEGGDKAKTTFIGLGVGLVYKFVTDGLKLFPSSLSWNIPKLKGAGFGADVLPALLGVGYIIGVKISAFLFAGAILGWFVIMPLISFFGSLAPDIILAPGTIPIAEMEPGDIWGSYLRYIGAGAVAFGGLFSLIQSLPTIIRTFRESIADFKNVGKDGSSLRTDRDLSLKLVLIVSLVIVLVVGMTDIIPVGIWGALIVAVFGFFFATVSARIVGIVGSSNSPISGMTIATLLITAFFFKATGNDGPDGMIATIAVGGIIAVISAISGDTSQDLKTGFIIGGTPRNQQIGEIIGVLAISLATGGILILLDSAWGFGSAEIAAPQATLMKMVVEGVMGNDLPWVLVISGAGIGLVLAVLGLPILPVAIGLYLPIGVSTPMMVGGLLRYILDRKRSQKDANVAEIDQQVESGILFSSGLIAGEGLLGIILAILTVVELPIALSDNSVFGDISAPVGQIAACIAFALIGYLLMRFSMWKKPKKR